MKIGSYLESLSNFEVAAYYWKELQFPKKGDVLTVTSFHKDPKEKDVFIITFAELKHPGLASKTYGKDNFIELIVPEIHKLLEEKQTKYEYNL